MDRPPTLAADLPHSLTELLQVVEQLEESLYKSGFATVPARRREAAHQRQPAPWPGQLPPCSRTAAPRRPRRCLARRRSGRRPWWSGRRRWRLQGWTFSDPHQPEDLSVPLSLDREDSVQCANGSVAALSQTMAGCCALHTGSAGRSAIHRRSYLCGSTGTIRHLLCPGTSVRQSSR